MKKYIPKLLLFDIDGTLISIAGAGMQALSKVIYDMFGIENATINICPIGYTDQMILSELFIEHNIDSKYKNKIINNYFRQLPKTIKDRKDAKTLAGIPELLIELKKNDNLYIGLLTGNMKESARIKLEAFGLVDFFQEGAYGSDSYHRNNLVKIAIERFKNKFNVEFENNNIFIIGDTLKDIECGKFNSVRTIAVATGKIGINTLRDANPDYLFADLSDIKKFINIIINNPT